MKKTIMNEEERYDLCLADNQYNRLEETDTARIKSMVSIATNDMEYTKIREPKADLKKECGTVFKLHYDCLHGLCEAFVMFDRIKISSHECLFVYICAKHKELELDLKFFDDIRTKRNGICYYGAPIELEYWNKIKLQLSIYISAIKKAIEEKL